MRIMEVKTFSRTPLHAWHADHGGRMVEFGGWSMPVQYSSIIEEHRATRNAVGLFDISHMGRLRFDGVGSAAFLDRILTRRVSGMGVGKIRYSLVANEQGGILDDVLVYHLADFDGTSFHLLVVNAGNRGKIVAWIKQELARNAGNPANVRLDDQTLQTAMISVQGPRALTAVESLVAAKLSQMEYYTGASTTIGGVPGIASRTGYTGEDGCELILPAGDGVRIWERILAASVPVGGKPVGLGARDTLRLEAGMPLYGHELSESIDPFQAGLSFAVQMNHEFIGRDELLRRKESPLPSVRVGLTLDGKRVPREHNPVTSRGERVGEVSSGTFSPTLEQPIAMAYVRPDRSAEGTELAVDIRGNLVPARVVSLPFYRREAG
jgi:aminomethyltransferase